MARQTLTDLIHDIRTMTGAGTDEYSIAGADYWSDNEIQNVLDNNRRDIYREQLTSEIDYVSGGTVQYFNYYSDHKHLEQTDGGTAIFWIEDAQGVTNGTANWTADYRRGQVTFTADQGGTAYYLNARAYDLHGAAADVLDAWAGYEKLQAVDVSTPEVRIVRSQKVKHLSELSQRYRARAWVTSFEGGRGDLC